jgi:uncharacterized protein
MVRAVLLLIFFILIARMFWRVVDNIIEGATGRRSGDRTGRAPQRGVHMVRDPVCGTFVVPDGALAIGEGRRQVFFCSTACRDKYRARTA